MEGQGLAERRIDTSIKRLAMLLLIVSIKITLSKYLSYYICYLLQSLFSQLSRQEAHVGPAL